MGPYTHMVTLPSGLEIGIRSLTVRQAMMLSKAGEQGHVDIMKENIEHLEDLIMPDAIFAVEKLREITFGKEGSPDLYKPLKPRQIDTELPDGEIGLRILDL